MANFSMVVDTKEETSLVGDLRLLCNPDGSEIKKNLKQTAEIFHKLGCIYANTAIKKEENYKITFIQSAVLLNASLSRDENNSNVKSDLKILCSKVLEFADVVQADMVDLESLALSLSDKISKLRDYANDQLDSLQEIPISGEDFEFSKLRKIEQVRLIQNGVTEQYKDIMRTVALDCVKILGQPVCGYALAGMGSLARSEVTPYSDFEHMILLEDGDHSDGVFEKFRWFAVIFQIIIVNLKETIIPSVCIPTLNNFTDTKHPEKNWFYDTFTTRGISFDALMPYACKNALGRPFTTERLTRTTELIQPVSKMVDYLKSDIAVKEGYHLDDVLSKTCFVYGDENIYKTFSEKRKSILDTQRKSGSGDDQLAEQIEEDKKSFEIWKNLADLHNKASTNMKRIVYRSSTIFISALGKFYGVNYPSCFDVVKELEKMQVLTKEDADKLLYVVAIACEIRLRMYMDRKSQRDDMLKEVSGKSYVSELYKLVGERCTMDYFDIVYSLHVALPDFKKKERPEKLVLQKGLFAVPAIYYFLHEYEKSIELFRADLELSSKTDEMKVYAHFRVGFALLQLERFQEAIAEFDLVIELLLTMNDYSERDTYIRKSRIAKGDCFRSKKDYNSALTSYEEAPVSEDDVTELNNLAVVHLRLKQYSQAKDKFKRAIENEKKLKSPNKESIALLTHNVGRCLYEQGEYESALSKMLEALKTRLALPYGKTDRNLLYNKYNIGRCHLKLGNLEEAIKCIEEALKGQQKLPDGIDNNLAIADSLHHLGLCRLEQEDYDNALQVFEQEKSTREKVATSKEITSGIENDLKLCLDCIEDCKTRSVPSKKQKLM